MHIYIFFISVILATQTLSIPQHCSLLLSQSECLARGTKRVWLARLPYFGAKQILFLMPTLNGRVFAMISFQKKKNPTITVPNEDTLRETNS